MSTLFTVHTGTLLRRPAATLEYGTPVEEDYVAVGNFRCRLSWEGGFETVMDRSNQKTQSRQGRLFALHSEPVTFKRGDRITVSEFPGPTFEVEYNRLIWDFSSPHHWELDVVQVEG